MKTGKLFLLAAAFVLLAGLSASALAQSKMASPAFLPPEPVVTVSKVNAIEVTDGTLGYDGETKEETAFGFSFLGRTTGAFPGSFTLSMNCAPPPRPPVDKGGIAGAFIVPILPPVTGITGGLWTLPVYVTGIRSTGYAGSLYGTIAKGTMYWDKTGTIAKAIIALNVDGGTQSWEGVRGYATFSGTLFVDEKTQKTMLSGDLVFDANVSPVP